MAHRDTHHVGDHLAHGEAIVARFATVTVPGLVKGAFKSFKSWFGKYQKASKAADPKKKLRDAALAAIGKADDALDASLDALANALVGAGLTKRNRAFAGFSRYSVSDMRALPYAEEATEVKALVAKVLEAKPSKEVAKAAKDAGALAGKVKKALGALTKPQAAYTRALAERDALLPAFAKSQSTLKKYAAAAWSEDVATVKGLFAAADAIVAPVKQAAKKAKKTRAKKKAASSSSKKGGGDPTTGS